MTFDRSKRTRAELREAIMRSASRMFAERGYESPTLREITKDADVSLPIVYWFFKDKRDLYRQCCMLILERDLAIVHGAIDGLSDPHDIIYAGLIAHCEITLRNRGTPIIHRLMIENDTEILESFASVLEQSDYREFNDTMQQLDSHVKAGWLPLVAMTVGLAEFSFFYRTFPSMPDLSRNAKTLAEYVLNLHYPKIEWASVAKRVAPRLTNLRSLVEL